MASLCSSINSWFDWTFCVLNSSSSLAHGYRNCWLCGKWWEWWNSSTFLHKGNIPHLIPLPIGDVKYAKWCFYSRSFSWFSLMAVPKALTRTVWFLAQTTIFPEEWEWQCSRDDLLFSLLRKLLLVCVKEGEWRLLSAWVVLLCRNQSRARSALTVPGSSCWNVLRVQPSWQHFGTTALTCHCTAHTPSPLLSTTEHQEKKKTQGISKTETDVSFRVVAQVPVRSCSLWSTFHRGKTEPNQTLPPNPCSLHTQLTNPLRNFSSFSRSGCWHNQASRAVLSTFQR